MLLHIRSIKTTFTRRKSRAAIPHICIYDVAPANHASYIKQKKKKSPWWGFALICTYYVQEREINYEKCWWAQLFGRARVLSNKLRQKYKGESPPPSVVVDYSRLFRGLKKVSPEEFCLRCNYIRWRSWTLYTIYTRGGVNYTDPSCHCVNEAGYSAVYFDSLNEDLRF